MRSRLKVCGLNDARVAAAAERLGADYLGFIFASKSPRHVTPEKVLEMLPSLTGRATRVGVFTGGTADEIASVCARCRLHVAQLHWRAPEGLVADLRARGLEVWTLAGGAPGDGVLFDSSHGDGETALTRGDYKTILAGGVAAANVADFLAQGPDILDVSGSLETSPGVKSLDRLEAFMTAFNEAQRRFF